MEEQIREIIELLRRHPEALPTVQRLLKNPELPVDALVMPFQENE